MAANVELRRPMGRDEALRLLASAPGVLLDEDGMGAPTPLDGAGIDPVLVGRVREDPSLPGTPIAALRSNRGREVKRRAQAMAF